MDLGRRDHGSGHDMDMGGSATSTAAMASSTSDMGGHNMGDMTMSMADMAMTFFTSSTTPLFSDDWTPSNLGQYAGTCIFLIILASILRFLLALRPLLEVRFWRKTAAATAVIKEEEQDGEDRLLNARPGQALTALRRDVGRRWSGWRVDTAAWRATYELLIAAAGYLLMLAVMTMNVGYFLSVLAGIWLGTFLLGGLSYDDRWSHC